ncbi:hypothetical protein BD626DRAFT_205540 [Schizophyllum amplum]|uniref:Uncharacterized protein n=1 Tax=Schizophyllum amplum TaxID=97359 RepID=A0A550BZI1_9AGAR|nr:hypothetical protein BD626DRAFT_205540 [Auriculariopsis ampla]
MSSPPADSRSPKRRQGVPRLLESFPAPPTFIPATPTTPGSLQIPQHAGSPPRKATTPTTPLSAYYTPPTSFISTLSGGSATSPPKHIPSPLAQSPPLPHANPPPSLPPSQPLPPVPHSDAPCLLLSSSNRKSTSDSASIRSLGKESVRSGRSSEHRFAPARQDYFEGLSPRPSIDTPIRPMPSIDTHKQPRQSVSSTHSNISALFPSPPLSGISEVRHDPADDSEDVLSASFTRKPSPNTSLFSVSSALNTSTSTPPSTLPSPNTSACPSPMPKSPSDPIALHRELRSARSRSRGHKESLRSRVDFMDIPPSPVRPILSRSMSEQPQPTENAVTSTPRGRTLGKPKKVAAALISGTDGRDSPDISEIIERTPKPKRSSKSLARSASTKSLARSASSKSVGPSRSSARYSKESSTSYASDDARARRPHAKSFGADTPYARAKRSKDIPPPPPSSFSRPIKQERASSQAAADRARDSTVSAFSLSAYGVRDSAYKRDSSNSNDPYASGNTSGQESLLTVERSPSSVSTSTRGDARSARRGASPFESLRRSMHSMQGDASNPYGGIHPDDEQLFAEMEMMLDGQASDASEGSGRRDKRPDAFAVEAVRSDDEGEGPFYDEVVESDEESDGSSIDLHTPLSKMMVRDGVLSPNSKVLQQQEEDILGAQGRGSVMSFASAVSTSSILKDTRDTPTRRVRHRDGKLLRGGLGLTTGLGWSDSEDEDAPSPFTRRVSKITLSRSLSTSNLRTASTLSLGSIDEDAPSSRTPTTRSLTSKSPSVRSTSSMPTSKSLGALSRTSSRSSGYKNRYPGLCRTHNSSVLTEFDEEDAEEEADEFGRSKSWKALSQPAPVRSRAHEAYGQRSEGTPSSDSTASISLPDTPADDEVTPTYAGSYNRNKDLPRIPSIGSIRRQGSTASNSVRRAASQKSVRKTTSIASMKSTPDARPRASTSETKTHMSTSEMKSRSSTPESRMRRPSFGSNSIPAPPSTKAPPLPTHRPMEMTRSPRPLQLPMRVGGDRPAVPVPRVSASLETPATPYSGLPSLARSLPAGHSGLPSPASPSTAPSSPNPVGPDGKLRPRTGTGMVYRSSRTGGGALRTPSQVQKRAAPPMPL